MEKKNNNKIKSTTKHQKKKPCILQKIFSSLDKAVKRSRSQAEHYINALLRINKVRLFDICEKSYRWYRVPAKI